MTEKLLSPNSLESPLNSVLGQAATIQYLKDLHANENWPKALLFYGRKGIGKKYCAIQYAKHINMTGDLEADQRLFDMVDEGSHPDIHLFSRGKGNASFKIDVIRESLEEAYKPRAEAMRRVLIFSDIQDFPSHKQSDALLKTVEDGFEDTLFIFTVTDLDLVFPTLRSRTVEAHFGPLSENIIYDLVEAEGFSDEEKRLASSLSNGSLDRATRLLTASSEDQLSGFELRNRALTFCKHLRRSPIHNILKFLGKIPDGDQVLFYDLIFGVVSDVLLLEEGISDILNSDRIEDLREIQESWDKSTYKIVDSLRKLQPLKYRKGLAFRHQLQSALLSARHEVLNND